MGHADIKTTMRYLHHKSRADDAQLLSQVFRPTKRKLAARSSTERSAVPASAPHERGPEVGADRPAPLHEPGVRRGTVSS
jgi:hypothetical protein